MDKYDIEYSIHVLRGCHTINCSQCDEHQEKILAEFDRLMEKLKTSLQSNVELGEQLEQIVKPMRNVVDWQQTVNSVYGLWERQAITAIRDYLDLKEEE